MLNLPTPQDQDSLQKQHVYTESTKQIILLQKYTDWLYVNVGII